MDNIPGLINLVQLPFRIIFNKIFLYYIKKKKKNWKYSLHTYQYSFQVQLFSTCTCSDRIKIMWSTLDGHTTVAFMVESTRNTSVWRGPLRRSKCIRADSPCALSTQIPSPWSAVNENIPGVRDERQKSLRNPKSRGRSIQQQLEIAISRKIENIDRQYCSNIKTYKFRCAEIEIEGSESFVFINICVLGRRVFEVIFRRSIFSNRARRCVRNASFRRFGNRRRTVMTLTQLRHMSVCQHLI